MEAGAEDVPQPRTRTAADPLDVAEPAGAPMHPMLPVDPPPAVRQMQYCSAPAVPENKIWLYCDALKLETPVAIEAVGPAAVPPPAV